MTDAAAAGRPVEARGLVKRYGQVVAVDGVDLTVEVGDVYGYLGPNGAGKTTSLRILLGLIRPSAGSARLFGRDPLLDGRRALDGVAGFVEAPRFYPYLSGRKNLEMLAAFDGGDACSRIGAVLDLVDLADRAGDRVGGYSHGMKQRLGLAAALLRRPRLLILDEPNTGLDPAGMRDMKVLVRRLSAEGMTVLLSSHQMADVEELCNRVAIIDHGRILYEGGVAELKRTLGGGWLVRSSNPPRAAVLAGEFALAGVELDGDDLRFTGEQDEVERFAAALVQADVGLRALVPQEATLEQVFFRLTEPDRAAHAPPAATVTRAQPVR
ncbi:MAG TPA: ABC transporter ATP-binding protein [Gaiellales bacterium]|nr:ABC transporter ATP-binding protein [Gaiellales bacterium]